MSEWVSEQEHIWLSILRAKKSMKKKKKKEKEYAHAYINVNARNNIVCIYLFNIHNILFFTIIFMNFVWEICYARGGRSLCVCNALTVVYLCEYCKFNDEILRRHKVWEFILLAKQTNKQKNSKWYEMNERKSTRQKRMVCAVLLYTIHLYHCFDSICIYMWQFRWYGRNENVILDRWMRVTVVK